MIKKMGSLLLTTCLLVSMIPTVVSAQTHAVDGTGQSVIVCPEPESMQVDFAGNGENGVNLSNDELFTGYVDQLFLGKNTVSGSEEDASLFGEEGREQLTDQGLATYNYLREEIEKIAAGERSITIIEIPVQDLANLAFGKTAPIFNEDLGVETLIENGALTEETINALYYKLFPDFEKVKEYLLNDLPFDCYWYDKTAYFSWGLESLAYNYTAEGELYLELSGSASFMFPVASDYQDKDVENTELYSVVKDILKGMFSDMDVESLSYVQAFYTLMSCFSSEEDLQNLRPEMYCVDTEKVQRAQTAAANARSVVEQYKDFNDYEKIRAYQEKICELTAYDDDAAISSVPQEIGMDPWQLINVFDGDPDTKVVCEGYAKAFQYLFDMSVFQNQRLRSILVTGPMSTEDEVIDGSEDGITTDGQDIADLHNNGHMWNIVTMEDGKNYLVDVTNCDKGLVGAPESEDASAYLVLRGMTGNIRDGYSVVVEKEGFEPKIVNYCYDANQFDLFDENRLSYSKEDYHPADLWLNDYEYTLDRNNSVITLTKYLGSEERVTVPFSAVVSGKTYRTVLAEGVFEENVDASIQNVQDLTESVGDQYSQGLSVTVCYETPVKKDRMPSAAEGEVVLSVNRSAGEGGVLQREKLDKFRVFIAHYNSNGRMTGVELMEKSETDNGFEFRGIATNQKDRLMVLDETLKPVMDAFTM